MGHTKRANNVNTTVPAPPKPYVLAPSGKFDGNDGKWSSFNINIGDDATGRGQNFRVLISTSSPVTMVPAPSPNWCDQDCSSKRGAQVFDGKPSSGFETQSSHGPWQELGIFNTPLPDWWSQNLSNAVWGSENVGLGESSALSLILPKQNVLLNQGQELFMGSFGLANGAVGTGTGAKTTFLVDFDNADQIPSMSYGYTAGASYRNGQKGVTGSLVLGGYDKSRVKVDSGLSVKMASEKNTTLIVGVTSITYRPDQDVEANTESFTARSGGFLATIDSTLPYLWLPEAICNFFVDKFQLEYDNKTELYLVDSSAHQNNKQQNATVSFKLGTSAQDSSTTFTTITLPYDAFDLQASYPLSENGTNYFPLKKSPNGMFVLGRTFLQESYIIVDYERLNFTVAPAIYSDPTLEQSLVPIYNKTYTPPTATPTLIPHGGGSLSPGAVAGVVVGVVIALLLAALGGFFWWRKRRADQAAAPPYTEKAQEIDTIAAGTEVKHRRVSELDSESGGPGSPKPSVGGYYDRDAKDLSPFPPISEMESPPAELYSPPPMANTPPSDGVVSDYFIAGNRVRRRGATRESSGNNTPGTPAPIAELPGDDGEYQVGGVHFDKVESPKLSSAHVRGPSDSSLHSNIDEVVARPEPSPERSNIDVKEKAQQTLDNVKEEGEDTPPERRPSHARGLSDTTDDTAVSAMTPEEMEQWALGEDNVPMRPLSG
ncbi:acid protease [Massarina eburnea CBS 473.64]|uniref:Acid protease n=1 Tax=Massarina eburnea CBS 473.64 TaxID=1395130 RepID=A0A6A6RQH0_9PLEO|nr:acid protease [Massarina eburnea CBS 473.64]